MKRSSVRKKSSNKLVLSVLRLIKGTFGRYLAIFAIIALGVGFFAGLRVSTDSMMKTADAYFRETNLYDFRLISTLGLTEEDVTAFAGLDGVEKAVGVVSADFICKGSEGDDVFRAHQLTDELNQIDLVAGRMPQKGNECLLDAKFFGEELLGTELILSDENSEETFNTFTYDRYNVVGLINNPYYVFFERGTTSLGQGRVTGFLYIPAEGFRTDYYTEIFLKLPEQGEIYSEAYENAIDEMEPAVSKLLEERVPLRRDSLKAEAETKIADGQAELDDGWETYRRERKDAEQKLKDALEELKSARKQLDDGRQQLEDGKAEFATQKAKADKELPEARKKLDDGWEQLNSGKAELAKQKKKAKKELSAARKKLDKSWSQLNAGKATLAKQKTKAEQKFAAAQAQLDSAAAQIAEGQAQLDQCKELYAGGEALVQGINSAGLGYHFDSPGELVKALSAGTDPMLIYIVNTALEGTGMNAASFAAYWNLAEEKIESPLNSETIAALDAKLVDARKQYQEGVDQLNAAKKTAKAAFEKADKKIASSEAQLLAGEAEYEAGKKTAVDAITKGEQDLIDGEQELVDGEAQYAEGIQALADAEKQIQDGERELADGEAEFAEGLRKYKDARAEADRKFAEAEKELADGEQELEDAREKLKDLENPSTYVLDRTANVGYATLESNMGIVRGVSSVFPLFFFLVAALVCVTTMTRMVDEQRTQNGVLMALGYGTGAIAGQYLFYAGSASLLGCISGFLLGSRFLPMALWNVYQIMYSIDRPVAFVLDWPLFAICTAIFLFCALGATYLVCSRDLQESPADLIRPKSPPSGKRILLERATFLWRRVKFLHKVSIRNILRYKKRMIMMILGVGGCTALLLTGFGIRDSIQYIVDYQFDEIELYDCSVSYMHALSEEDEEKFCKKHADTVEETEFLHVSMMDLSTSEKTLSVNAVVYEEEPEGFIDLHRKKEHIPWPGKGETVINNRLAEDLGIRTGDVITLRTPEFQEVTLTVSGIFDNYIYDYAFVRAETFREQCGFTPETKTAYLKLVEGAEPHAVGAQIAGENNVAMVNVTADMRERVSNMLSSMNYIVLIVLVCAGALAFIVLYNLTNISINERRREIATLKVLGFYPKESAAYVFRENMILTGISALAGLPMGYALLRYVMGQIKISSLYFGCRAALLSYILAVALTFLFAVLVAFFLYFKLDKIDMADSLKAIE